MKVPSIFSTRRFFLGSAVVPFALSVFPRVGAAQLSAPVFDLDAIHNPAIPVSKPSSVFLVAITRVGGRLVAAGVHGVIIYSDDNGATWVQASVPVDVTITCVGFATPKLGWAAGESGVILGTVDGGQSWQLQLDGIRVNQLALIAAQAATEQNSTAPGAPLAEKRAHFFSLAGPSKPFLTMLVVSPEKVFVLGSYRMVELTTDGGKTWTDWSLHVYDRVSHNLYDAIFFGGYMYVVGEVGLVLCSKDGGDSFIPLPPPVQATLFGVVGIGDNILIVFGVAGNCFRTTDNGTTWVPINLGTPDDLTAGRVINSSVVITSETGQVFVSKDDGVTFTEVPNLAPVAIFDFEAAANGQIVCVGAAGINRLPANVLNS